MLHVLVLGGVAGFAPVRVVPVLLAPFRIPSRGLKVSVREAANPDIFVGGGNDQSFNSRQSRLILYLKAVRVQVVESVAVPLLPYPRLAVGDKAQTGSPYFGFDFRSRIFDVRARTGRRGKGLSRMLRSSNPQLRSFYRGC